MKIIFRNRKSFTPARKMLFFSVGLLVLIEIALRLAGLYYVQSGDWKLSTSSQSRTRILCLGESSTYGLWVERGETYPKQLERKLNEAYPNRTFETIYPAHIAQNTSQMAARMEEMIKTYQPHLILLMAGINNGWAFGESNLWRFTSYTSKKIFLLTYYCLDRLRLFRLVRYVYAWSVQSLLLGWNRHYIFGFPEKVALPKPKSFFSELAKDEDLIALWNFDTGHMVKVAQKFRIPIAIMTYPLRGFYTVPDSAYEKLAKEYNVVLIRNDLAFLSLVKDGKIDQYLFDDHWHLKGNGYELLADNIFQNLRRLNLIPKPQVSIGSIQWQSETVSPESVSPNIEYVPG